MDNGAAKLDQLAEKLLDIGKRNSMIAFRDTKSSTVEVLFPSSFELFEKVKTANTFEVFAPHLSDDEEDEKENAAYDKDEYVQQYASKLKKQNQLLLYHASADPMTALAGIDKKAREYIEETGVNVAYMAFSIMKAGRNQS